MPRCTSDRPALMPRTLVGVAAALVLIAPMMAVTAAAARAPDPNSPRFKAVTAIRGWLDGHIETDAFVARHVAPSVTEHAGRATAIKRLDAIADALRGLDIFMIEPVGPFEVRMGFEGDDGDIEAQFALAQEPPHHVTDLWIVGGPSLSGVARVEPGSSIPMSWDTLEARLDDEAKLGFSGVALVVRDDKVVLHRGYGMANREKQIPFTTDTIFAIGSTPIDFTHAGILLLAQEGTLALDDPISKYFDGVPPDKRAMTLEHLRTGRSGLRDFHDVPDDRDPDHGWIDRDEAVRRILGHELLFAPGTGEAHSHSAWGLLAAVIEIASGQSYPEFTRERLFAPAGMRDTGFFGEPIPEARLAIGYGSRRDGSTNAPPFWGRTSWLVMGSGGQVSTAADMHRWLKALRGGAILKPEWARRYFGSGGDVMAGGDMYGFEIMLTQGPGSLMIVLSNTNDPRERMQAFQRLGRDLAELVNMRPFSLGIGMGPHDDGVEVTRVMPGSAAERDGLKAGDVLVRANGAALADDPIAVIDGPLRTGAPITFELLRDGEKRTVVVTPVRR